MTDPVKGRQSDRGLRSCRAGWATRVARPAAGAPPRLLPVADLPCLQSCCRSQKSIAANEAQLARSRPGERRRRLRPSRLRRGSRARRLSYVNFSTGTRHGLPVSRLPYAVLIDKRGIVKGNSSAIANNWKACSMRASSASLRFRTSSTRRTAARIRERKEKAIG